MTKRKRGNDASHKLSAESKSTTEIVKSLFERLVESPAETLIELAPQKQGFISTLKRKQFREFTKEERTAAARILFSSVSSTDRVVLK